MVSKLQEKLLLRRQNTSWYVLPKVRMRFQSGFTIAEVAFAMTILLMMVILFGAVVPVCLQAARASGDYSMVEGVAHHKIEQLRGCGFENLNLTELQALNVIDANQATGFPNNSPLGFPSGAISYSFTSIDSLTSLLPSNAQGVLTVAPDQNAPAGQADDITITISWTAANGVPIAYSDSSIIANV